MTHSEFPVEGVALTHLLVVSDMEQSRHFYRDVLGATVYREYGGTSCVLNFSGSWLLLVTGGGPTKDKPKSPIHRKRASPGVERGGPYAM